MLKIYGADLSAPANKVRMTANKLGLEFEYVQIKVREGEHKTEEFLAINPVGKIPAMDDDGFKLFESNAISKYLCDKNGSDIYPKDLKLRAVVDQWIDFVSAHVSTALGRVLFNRVFAPFAKIEKDERSLADGLTFLDRYLPIVDKQLANNAHLAGETFSLADIVLISSIDPLEVAQIDISQYQNIVKYRAELKTQEFYQKTYKDYGEALKKMMSS